MVHFQLQAKDLNKSRGLHLRPKESPKKREITVKPTFTLSEFEQAEDGKCLELFYNF